MSDRLACASFSAFSAAANRALASSTRSCAVAASSESASVVSASSVSSSARRVSTPAASSISAVFARLVGLGLRDAPLQFAAALPGAPLLGVERLARQHQPLQRRAGLGLRLAQRGKVVRGDGLQPRGLRLLARALGDVGGLRLADFCSASASAFVASR
jgi:hypothetical protein